MNTSVHDRVEPGVSVRERPQNIYLSVESTADISVIVPLVVLFLVVVIVLPMVLFGGTQLYRAFRLRQNDPADIQTVRTGSDGPVELTGTAEELGETVTGKYSDRECLAYAWEREERDAGSTTDNREINYHMEDFGTEGEPFHVRDETGTVAVDPTGANIYAEKDEWKNEERIHREKRIEADDRLHVYGHKQDIIERQDGLGTESTYVGSNTNGMGKLDKIRARPHMALGHVLGISSDLHITVGDESKAIRGFAIKGAFFTAFGLVQLIAAGLVIFASLQ
jgi:hypothetical protein